MYQFKMPDIGEGTHETEITQWFFAEGDTIHEDDVLVEVQSDKALAELPCPVTGTIAKLYVAEGELALVGSVIADITTDQDASATTAPAQPAPVASETAESAPAEAGAPKAEQAPVAAPVGKDDAPESTGAATPKAATAATVDRGDVDIRTLAVPRVRKYARSKGVDLTVVPGTGNHGKITMEDVDAFLAGGSSAAQPAAQNASQVTEATAPVANTVAAGDANAAQAGPTPNAAQPATPAAGSTPTGGERREKMPSIKKVAAKAMTEAAAVPTVTVLDRVEVSALVEHRARLKEYAAKQGVKLTYTPYIVKACVAMLKKHPELNGRVDMAAGELVYYDSYNIGVATNTDHGLFVPIIRDADRKSLIQLSREITELGDKAKAGTLSKAEMSGGSMSITNVGGAATGGVWSTPIINSPEAAIVGIGRFEEEFLPDENKQPVLKPVCKLSFTFDHRFIDGVSVQGAINDLKEFLHNPDLLLAEG